jgi:serine protease Do
VDGEGRLIGINTQIKSSSEGNEGIGFAVPVNLARHVTERLISGGTVTRGYLGVIQENLTSGLAESFNLPDQNGALVDEVLPGDPAQKAGIESGDVIVEFNGKKVTDREELQLMISECSPGTEVTVKVFRDGAQKTVTVKLGELPGDVARNNNNNNNNNNNRTRPNTPASSTTDALDGVQLYDLNAAARQQLQIPDSVKGAIVTGVSQDSSAAAAGLKAYDVITEINRHAVANSQNAVDLCEQAKTKRVLFKIWRRGDSGAGTLFLSVDNTKRQ